MFAYKGWSEEANDTVTYFDRSLHKFLKGQNFFINSKTLAINILLQHLKVRELTYLPTGEDVPLDPEVIALYEEFVGTDTKLDSLVIESKLDDWLLKVDSIVSTSCPSLENYLSFPILLYTLNYLGEYLVRGVRKHD